MARSSIFTKHDKRSGAHPWGTRGSGGQSSDCSQERVEPPPPCPRQGDRLVRSAQEPEQLQLDSRLGAGRGHERIADTYKHYFDTESAKLQPWRSGTTWHGVGSPSKSEGQRDKPDQLGRPPRQQQSSDRDDAAAQTIPSHQQKPRQEGAGRTERHLQSSSRTERDRKTERRGRPRAERLDPPSPRSDAALFTIHDCGGQGLQVSPSGKKPQFVCTVRRQQTGRRSHSVENSSTMDADL